MFLKQIPFLLNRLDAGGLMNGMKFDVRDGE